MKQIISLNKDIINKKTCQQKKIIKQLQLLQDPYKNKVNYTQRLVLPKSTCKQKLLYLFKVFKKIKINRY